MSDPGVGLPSSGTARAVSMDGDSASKRALLNRSVRWTALAQGLTAILQMGVVVVLARLLEPSDFGLLAMASAVMAIVAAVQTLGTHGPLVQREQVAPVLIDTVFLLNLGLAFVLMIALILAAPLVAAAYQTPAVEPLVQVIAVVLVLYALSGVPGALLARRMQFGAIAVVHTVGAATFAITALVLAWQGYGVWSLVVGTLASASVEAVIMLVAARFWPRLRFSFTELRSIAGYAANMTGVNILNVALRNADSVIIGRWLGASSLGLYGMATRFTRQPVDMFVSSVLGPVLFPAYSRIQSDDALTARTMERAMGGAAFVMFPLLGGVAAVARPFTEGVLGPEWAGATLLLMLMAPVGMLRTLVSATGALFLARDRTHLLLLIHLGGGVLLLCAYLAGVQIGLVAVVVALFVAETVITAIKLGICARLVRTPLLRLVAGVRGPLFATAIMVAGVMMLDRILLARDWADPAILAVLVPTGMVIYTLLALVLRMQAVHDLIDVIPAPLASRLRGVVATAMRTTA